MAVHEDITAAWAKARPVLADACHPDTYLIVRLTRVPDGSGGHTNVEAVVESGKCALTAATTVGSEGVNGPLTVSVTGYTVELPKGTTLEASDVLYVNSRKFEVIAVQKGGDHEVFPVARVEEAS